MAFRIGILTASLTFTALVGHARADQCAAIEADQAAAAQKLAAKGAELVEYCEPCKGRSQVGITVATSEIKPAAGKSSLVVNGRMMDLAYTFLKTGKTTYTNLALMVGCEAEGVSASISITGKPAPAPPPTEAQLVMMEIRVVDGKIGTASKAVADAPTEAERTAAVARLDALKKEAEALRTKLRTLLPTPRPPTPAPHH